MIDRVDSIATAPLRRLAVAVTVRDDLTDMAEAVLDHFVGEARDAGHSWAEIGDVLGVTRQAAQQRDAGPGAARRVLLDLDPPMHGWGHGGPKRGRDGRGRRRPGGPGGRRGGGRGHLFRHMSDDTRAVYRSAFEEAAEAGDRRITTVHLLAALLDSGHASAFERGGLTRDQVTEVLQQRRSGDEAAEVAEDDRWFDRPRMSRSARRALEAAIKHASRHEADHIAPRHLMLGLLHGEGRISALIDEVGLDRDTLIAELADAQG